MQGIPAPGGGAGQVKRVAVKIIGDIGTSVDADVVATGQLICTASGVMHTARVAVEQIDDLTRPAVGPAKELIKSASGACDDHVLCITNEGVGHNGASAVAATGQGVVATLN